MVDIEPLILSNNRSGVRSIAEAGYHIGNATIRFREDSAEYINMVLEKVWREVLEKNNIREISITDAFAEREIVATDLLVKYVGHHRFTTLFNSIWTDTEPYPTPHTQNSITEVDKVKIIFETKRFFGGKEELSKNISIEDADGLGITFKNVNKPTAYGPRKFTERVADFNRKLDIWPDTLRMSCQALLLLAVEAERLEFKLT